MLCTELCITFLYHAYFCVFSDLKEETALMKVARGNNRLDAGEDLLDKKDLDVDNYHTFGFDFTKDMQNLDMIFDKVKQDSGSEDIRIQMTREGRALKPECHGKFLFDSDLVAYDREEFVKIVTVKDPENACANMQAYIEQCTLTIEILQGEFEGQQCERIPSLATNLKDILQTKQMEDAKKATQKLLEDTSEKNNVDLVRELLKRQGLDTAKQSNYKQNICCNRT